MRYEFFFTGVAVSLTRTFLIGSVVIFGLIGGAAIVKKHSSHREAVAEIVQEVPLAVVSSTPQLTSVKVDVDVIPEVDRISQLFALDSSKFDIVETISYTSRVPWLKDRPAWIADYASHYATSRHFIARSLNRKTDYFTQKISPGDRFNVFKRDKNIQFDLVVDLSHCRMWFYYYDISANERVLLKTYHIGVGRVESKSASGYLTPIGNYELGSKVAIYKMGTMGVFQERKTEMIRVFGTRWIPFEKEIEGCTESAKGLGLHGAPWVLDPASGKLVEERSTIGKYESDGCIRLASEDIEEIFSIIITKPTQIHIVKDFHDAKLPGVEKISNP